MVIWLYYLKNGKNNHIFEVPGVLWSDAGHALDVAHENGEGEVESDECLERSVVQALKGVGIENHYKKSHDNKLQE